MTLRFSTTRAIGAAIAITLGSVSTAMAQTPVRKDVSPAPTPVTKETPAPAPAPDTTAAAPAPAPAPMAQPAPVAVDTTTTVTTVTTTETSTGTLPEPTMRMRSGWYLGLAGAAELPQNSLRDFYDTGWGVEGHIGWDPVNSPLGLRVNLGYARLNSKTEFGAGLRDPQIYQAVGDAKLRLPFGKGLLSGLYAVGGGGVYYFRNYDSTLNLTTNPGTGGSVTNTFNPEDKTQFGANVGGGIQFGLGNATLFVESRYVRIFTSNRNSDMVPVAAGLTFNW